MKAGPFLLLTLSACGAPPLVYHPDAPGCSDVDFDDPPPETLDVVQDGVDWALVHDGVFQRCDAVFAPEVEADGRVIVVRERWEADGEGSCDTCFSPQIVFSQLSPGRYKARWYVEDDEVPFGSLSFKVQ